MATSTTSANPLSSFMSRQVRSGRTTTGGRPEVAPAQSAAAAAGAAIDLEQDHPASSSPSVQQAAELPDPRAAQQPKKSRFGSLIPSRDEPNEEKPVVVEQAPSGRFGSLVDPSASPGARAARMNMAAVKALTPLVAAISFHPGNAAEPALKSAALANLIAGMKKAANDIVLAMTPTISNVDWARGQVMQVLANVAAKQWETAGRVDLDSVAGQVMQLFKNPSVELESVMDELSSTDSYMEARTPEVAKARLAVSVSSAAWELYDWVTRDSLRLKDQPARVFSYERPLDQIIGTFLGRALDEARAMQIQVNSADLQLSHLQGSVRRLVQLIGAEYVTQTKAILKWIDEAVGEPAEQERRHATAVNQFDTHVVQRVMTYVHANFIGIEHRARKLMDEYDYENNSQQKNRQGN